MASNLMAMASNLVPNLMGKQMEILEDMPIEHPGRKYVLAVPVNARFSPKLCG